MQFESDPVFARYLSVFRDKIGDFIKGVFAVFQDLDFTFLEMNPFTLVDGEPYSLDMRGELDDTAAFKNFKKWGGIEFPLPFGRVLSSTESFIHELDEKTSASLKFTVLNPKGRIWTMVAGGGASVIYADTVGDLGYASELGNYAEYSGAPNEEEVLHYARVVLDCATADPDGRKRALLIGGGIANFTDVAATFNGIIRALREKGQMNDASEVLAVVFDCLHKSCTSSDCNSESHDSKTSGAWDCTNNNCIAHTLFGMNISEQMSCHSCSLKSRQLTYSSFFHNVNAKLLRETKIECADGDFDKLLKIVDKKEQLACDKEDGGCGEQNYIQHIISNPPHVFIAVLG